MKRLSAITFLLAVCVGAYAQQASQPLDLPVSFSGTYGELRGNHFHSGFDFRTGGHTGEPVHAIKDGWISRIAVTPGGYGNGLYITHYDGTMSVYGHLSAFLPAMDRLVRAEQYRTESYSVNLYFKKDEHPVKKGDVVAKSGNTGSSGGPHLHLEVRDSESGLPLNYIRDGYYTMNDTQSPVFQRIKFYSYEDSTGIPETSMIYSFNSPAPLDRVLTVPERSYVCIDAVDRQEGTTARLAVETYRVTLDGEQIFRFDVKDMPSGTGRYIKSLIEYGESYYSGMDMVKTYVEPGNALRSHIEYRDKGLIVLDDDRVHTLRIEVSDIVGNSSSITYRLQRSDPQDRPEALPSDPARRVAMLWNVPNAYRAGGLDVSIPSGTLYRSIWLSVEKQQDAFSPSGNVWSPVWWVGDRLVPLHKSVKIFISAPDVPQHLRDKALLVSLGKNGQPSAEGGNWVSDGVRASVSSFGTFYVAVDSIAPHLAPAFTPGGRIKGDMLYLAVSDELSGLQDFRVEIDGKWAIAIYRRGRIAVTLDPERFKRGVRHDLHATATDGRGNVKELDTTFEW